MSFIKSVSSLRTYSFLYFVNNLFKFHCCFSTNWRFWVVAFASPRPDFRLRLSRLRVNVFLFYPIKSYARGISFWGWLRRRFNILRRLWNWFFTWRSLILRLFCFIEVCLRRILFLILICFCKNIWFYWLFWRHFLVLEIFKIFFWAQNILFWGNISI